MYTYSKCSVHGHCSVIGCCLALHAEYLWPRFPSVTCPLYHDALIIIGEITIACVPLFSQQQKLLFNFQLVVQ